jgi:hypothetical protein
MQVQQLRIGNIVSFVNDNRYLSVESVNRSFINDIYPLETIKPVDLGRDTLNRISFSHIHSNDKFEITTKNRVFTAARLNNQCFLMSLENVGVGVVCSLHSLQNLIYAIATEEIEVAMN